MSFGFAGQLKKDKSGESNCSNCCVIVWRLILHHLLVILIQKMEELGHGAMFRQTPTDGRHHHHHHRGWFPWQQRLWHLHFTKASLWYHYRGIFYYYLGGVSGNIWTFSFVSCSAFFAAHRRKKQIFRSFYLWIIFILITGNRNETKREVGGTNLLKIVNL